MDDVLIEAEVIPAWAERQGLRRCFFYTGNSMRPTFREGHMLYVAPQIHNVAEGDVVVFRDPTGESLIVHRIVDAVAGGWVTRGDNNRHPDAHPVRSEALLGRVEVAENARRRRPVPGGRRGLTWARGLRVWRGLRAGLVAPLRPLYRALGTFPPLQRWLRRLAGERVRVLHLRSPQGPWLKVLLGERVIARWAPGQPAPVVRKPYDLLGLREQLCQHRDALTE
jgi:hypothetical protein